MNRTHLIIGATLLAVSSSLPAAVLTRFEDNLHHEASPNWSYFYNAGAIGDSTRYTPLIAVPEAISYWWDGDGIRGVDPLPPSDPNVQLFGYVNFGMAAPGVIGGHPGRGSAQSSDGLSHYAIAAYTLPEASPITIESSLVTTINTSLDGIDVLVFVNNELKISSFTNPWPNSLGASTTFDGYLGQLAAGDVVYVAIGSRAYDNYDAFTLAYSLSNLSPETTIVPEPASLGLALLALPLLRRR